MTKSNDAYEHQSSVTGFGSDSTQAENQHREGSTPGGSAERNEINAEEGLRANQQHARSTHQDTKITEAEGLKRLRQK